MKGCFLSMNCGGAFKSNFGKPWLIIPQKKATTWSLLKKSPLPHRNASLMKMFQKI
jgi:hypothetical protein